MGRSFPMCPLAFMLCENPALLAEEASDREEKDVIDDKEAEHIEKQLIALLDEDDASSDDGSESSVNYDVEDTTHQELLAKKQSGTSQSRYTQLFLHYINNRCRRMSGSGGIL
jgi:hypothetical protein